MTTLPTIEELRNLAYEKIQKDEPFSIEPLGLLHLLDVMADPCNPETETIDQPSSRCAPRNVFEVYVAAPYSSHDDHVRNMRFEAINRYTAWLIKQGCIPFSPISMSHPVFGAGADMDLFEPGDQTFDTWQELDLRALAASESLHVLCLPGYTQSNGVLAELTFAAENNIPVFEVEWVEPGNPLLRRPYPRQLVPAHSPLRSLIGEMRRAQSQES